MKHNSKTTTRRAFMSVLGATTAGFTVVPRHAVGAYLNAAPSDKLDIAFVGAGGRAGANLGGLRSENVVALSDVDMARGARGFMQHPQAKKYRDFRKMLDAVEKSIDAVVVSTPDHTHAVAAMDALRRKKHVYCEKPLAHSIHEIRALMKAARDSKVVTQLGNQGHSSGDIRKCCEWIWDGAIGSVHTVHAGCGAVHCRIDQLGDLKERPPVPATLDWDLWLGPAAARPYHPHYLPGRWRAWMPFGSGTTGDWVCHVMDPSFWALDLGAPTTILAEADNYDPKKHADTFPAGSRITFTFPAKGRRGPVTVYWYNGNRTIPRPDGMDKGKQPPRTGAVIIGDKGIIVHGSHGAGGVRLVPEAKMRAYTQPPQKIPRTRGHHNDWLDAIKRGGQAGSNFEYGGPLTELAQLGIIAIKMLGTRLEWDSKAMQFPNCKEANKYVNPPSRSGWKV